MENEEHEDCDFCLKTDENRDFNIKGNELLFSTWTGEYTNDPNHIVGYMDIEFCPVCGRNLLDAE